MLRVSLAYFAAVSIIFLITLSAVSGKKAAKDVEKPTWAKKDIRDYSDADMERLLDQWDVGYLLKLLKMILILIFVFFFQFLLHRKMKNLCLKTNYPSIWGLPLQ